jgi:endonuclease/exonuclease/phosphatase family metal-dependent hydrolase
MRSSAPHTLRVMTFNVRQPDQDDGPDAWEFRRELLVETIVERDADVIGTQELFTQQAAFIQSHAPHYRWFGVGRYGDDRDKHVGIFYRADRVSLLAHGDVWLSETPEVAGSSSWDIIRPRQLTWGAFGAVGVGTFYVLNTHFPYRPVEEAARHHTADLIVRQAGAIASNVPVVVTADFNAAAGGDVYRRLAPHFRDAWCDAPARVGPHGTLNAFGRRPPTDRRIDWILHRSSWRVRDVETVVTTRDGRYPSDHFPVVATFEV